MDIKAIRGILLSDVQAQAGFGLVAHVRAVPLDEGGWAMVVGLKDGSSRVIFNARRKIKPFKSMNAMIAEIGLIGLPEVKSVEFSF